MEYDCLVVGAGVSGIAAALAAQRLGAKTLLIEKESLIGGAITQSFVSPLMTFHASEHKQIVKGIAQELITEAVKLSICSGHSLDMTGTASTITPIIPDLFQYVILKKLTEVKVDFLIQTFATEVKAKNNQIIEVRVQNKSGEFVIKPKFVIDATGDADLAAKLGLPFQIGREKDQKTQPMSLLFKVGKVDFLKIRQEIFKNPANFTLNQNYLSNPEKFKSLAVSGFFNEVKKAQNQGLLLFRDRMLFFELPFSDQVIVNTTRINNLLGIDAFDLSAAYQQGINQVYEIYQVLKDYIPGFEKSELIAIAPKVGVRETRHIVGEYTLTAEDVILGRKFEDSIAYGGFPIDIHSPDGTKLDLAQIEENDFYGIPYRTLLPKGVNNLLVTGRAISATHEANASARVTPTCMALGQAAGTAAYLALKHKTNFCSLDVSLVQEILNKI
ncbi:MAG: FAD-dependent oxidoreductase [Candidatus Margulisiibacteriota bacterium]|jgi:hypothetical protein